MPIRSIFLCLLLACYSIACAGSPSVQMSRDRLESLISESSSNYRGNSGAVQFTFDGVGMAFISDIDHDRMRIVAPIVARAELDDSQLDLMLIANYHSSLDARYALS